MQDRVHSPVRQQEAILTSGIDLLVRCPSLDAIMAALSAGLGLTSGDILKPDDDIMDRLDVLQRPLQARISRLGGGGFAFKVELDGGAEKRDYGMFARNFAAALQHDVVMPDERAPDPITSIRIQHGAPDLVGWIEDAEPDGFWFRVASKAG